jgi:hypothetical protein
LIFDIKMGENFRRKARKVQSGHLLFLYFWVVLVTWSKNWSSWWKNWSSHHHHGSFSLLPRTFDLTSTDTTKKPYHHGESYLMKGRCSLIKELVC